MKTDVNGCSACPKGKESYETFTLATSKGLRELVQYDYRDNDGDLFSTTAKNLEQARDRKSDWLVKKLIGEYQKDPNCRPDLWIMSAGVNEEEKTMFLVLVRQSVMGMRLSNLSVKDICEELTDLRKDLCTINDFNEGLITRAEFSELTVFKPEDRAKVEWAIRLLSEEKIRRNNPEEKKP